MSVLTVPEKYHFRKLRTRRKIFGTAARPRFTVYRSSKHIYTQFIDDVKGHTLLSACTLDPEVKGSRKTGATVAAALALGKAAGGRAKAAGIETVVFDRGGRPFHGRIKAVADGAREAGLKF